MTSVLKYAAVAALTGAIALATATPSEARRGRNAAVIGGIAAGVLLGAAVANANRGYYYGPGYYPGPGYAYEPVYEYYGPPAYGPVPYYNQGPRYYYPSDGTACGGSPAAPNFRPCD
ncbi:MAG: hypothetical protein Q8L84_16145 [Hyphomonas sp.]|nr:hypothetical protein [Hyphomonas sp.]